MYTAEQRAVIQYRGGHALVAAVAGSGKSQTLIGRIGSRLAEGVPANRILALMFNRAAKDAFLTRLASALRGKAAPAVHTFHGHARRIEGELVRAGAIPAGKLLDEHSPAAARLARAVLTAAVRAVSGANVSPDRSELDEFNGFITRVKSRLDAPIEVAERFYPHRSARLFADAFGAYEDARQRAGWRTFDDLLWDTIPFLLSNASARDQFANRYTEIVTDELQDTSPIQFELLRIIAAPSAIVIGVGDDDQTIYEFRSAEPRIILRDFEAAFSGTRRFVLSRTFRFGHTLALAASQLIDHNAERIPKTCVAAPGTPDTRVHVHRQMAGGRIPLPELIYELRGGRRAECLGDFTVLVRYVAQMIPIELDLLVAGVPYRIEGRSALFDTPVIGGLIAILALAARRWPDGTSREQHARMLGELLKLPTMYLTSQQVEGLVEPVAETPERLADALRVSSRGVASHQARSLSDRADMIEILLAGHGRSLATQILDDYAAGTRLRAEIRRTAFSSEAADEALGVVDAFTNYVNAVGGSVDSVIDRLGAPRSESANSDCVLLTTIHRSKGLQAPVVVLPDWGSGAFPRHGTGHGEFHAEIEGERRLAYVAMTRAQHELHIFVPPDPNLDQAIDAQAIPDQGIPIASRFLYETRLGTAHAVSAWLSGSDALRHAKPTVADVYNRYLDALGKEERVLSAPVAARARVPILRLEPGSPVIHDAYGPGVLLEVDGRIARCDFAGTSRLVLIAANQLRSA